jgi:DnaK suppressor protein
MVVFLDSHFHPRYPSLPSTPPDDPAQRFSKEPSMAKSSKKPVVRKPVAKAKPAVKKIKPVQAKATKPVKATAAKAPKASKFKLNKVPASYQPLLKKLLDRRSEILGQVDHLEKELREEMSETQSTPGDIADHGSGELNQHLSVTLMENDRMELDLIERALARFELLKYGECENCEKVISLERLKALPWATRCITCQSRTEGA